MEFIHKLVLIVDFVVLALNFFTFGNFVWQTHFHFKLEIFLVLSFIFPLFLTSPMLILFLPKSSGLTHWPS